MYEPYAPFPPLLSGLPSRLSSREGVPNLGGEPPNEPRSACESEEAPGPGIDEPEAPARGVAVPEEAPPSWIRCPPVGDPWIGLAKRAVVERREGDPVKDSERWWLDDELEGIGRLRGEPGGFGLRSDMVVTS